MPTPAMYFTHGSESTASRISFSATSDSFVAVARLEPADSGTTSYTLENDTDPGESELSAAEDGEFFTALPDISRRVRGGLKRL